MGAPGCMKHCSCKLIHFEPPTTAPPTTAPPAPCFKCSTIPNAKCTSEVDPDRPECDLSCSCVPKEAPSVRVRREQQMQDLNDLQDVGVEDEEFEDEEMEDEV